jgi:hypothetical protein
MEAMLMEVMSQSPLLSMILMVMGGLRLVLKPIMAYLEKKALESPEKTDDEKLAKMKESGWYKVLSFVLDYSASVKLPK